MSTGSYRDWAAELSSILSSTDDGKRAIAWMISVKWNPLPVYHEGLSPTDAAAALMDEFFESTLIEMDL